MFKKTRAKIQETLSNKRKFIKNSSNITKTVCNVNTLVKLFLNFGKKLNNLTNIFSVITHLKTYLHHQNFNK